MSALIVLIAIIIVCGLFYAGTYNKLVRAKNQIEEAGAAIDTELKKRYDLVPNLVETVKGYASHEKGTLEAVIQARNSAVSATTREEKEGASKNFTSALRGLFALSESYPDLKANTSFVDLEKQLASIEEDLKLSRKYYNANVKLMNNIVETFPTNIIASLAHYKPFSYLAIEEEAKARVEVKF